MYINASSGTFRLILDEDDVKKMIKVLKPSTEAGGVRNFFYIEAEYKASEDDKLEADLTIMHLDDYTGKETEIK